MKVDEKIIGQIKKANTARHVLDIIKENQVKGFFDIVCQRVYKQMKKHSQQNVPL